MERKHISLGEFAPHLCYGADMSELVIPNGHPSSLVQFSTTLSSTPARPVYISPYSVLPSPTKNNMYSSPYSCITGPIMDEQLNLQTSSGAITYDPRDHPVSIDSLGPSMQVYTKNLQQEGSLCLLSCPNPTNSDSEYIQKAIIAAQASQLLGLPPPSNSYDKKQQQQQQQGSMSSSLNLQDGWKPEDNHIPHDIYQRQESKLSALSNSLNGWRTPGTWNRQPSFASSSNIPASAPRYEINDNPQFALPQINTRSQHVYYNHWSASNEQNQQPASFASSSTMPKSPPKFNLGFNTAPPSTNLRHNSGSSFAFPQGYILSQDGTSRVEGASTAWIEQPESQLSSSSFDSPMEFLNIGAQFRNSQVNEEVARANNRGHPWDLLEPSYCSNGRAMPNGENQEGFTSLSSSSDIPHSLQSKHDMIYQSGNFYDNSQLPQADDQAPSQNFSGGWVSSKGWVKSPNMQHLESMASSFVPHKSENNQLPQFATTQSNGHVAAAVHRATPYNFLPLPTPNYGVPLQSENVELATSRSTPNVSHPQYQLPIFNTRAHSNNASNSPPSLPGPLVGQPDFGFNPYAGRYSASVSHQPSTDSHFPPAFAQRQANTLSQIAKPQSYHSHYIPQAYGQNLHAPPSLSGQQWGTENTVHEEPIISTSASDVHNSRNINLGHFGKNTPFFTLKEVHPQYVNPQTTHHHYFPQASNGDLLARPTSQNTSSPTKKGRGKPAKASFPSNAPSLHFKSPSVEKLEGQYPAVPSPDLGQPGYRAAPYHPGLNGPGNTQSRNGAPRKRNRNRNRNRTPAKSSTIVDSEDLVAELHFELSPEQNATIGSINENDGQSAKVTTQLEALMVELEALDADEETFSTARVMEISAEIESLEKKLEEIVELGNRLEDKVNAKLSDDMERNEEGFVLDLATLTK